MNLGLVLAWWWRSVVCPCKCDWWAEILGLCSTGDGGGGGGW